MRQRTVGRSRVKDASSSVDMLGGWGRARGACVAVPVLGGVRKERCWKVKICLGIEKWIQLDRGVDRRIALGVSGGAKLEGAWGIYGILKWSRVHTISLANQVRILSLEKLS